MRLRIMITVIFFLAAGLSAGATLTAWVQALQGDVKIRTAESADRWAPVRQSMSLKSNDMVRTGPGSWVLLAFDNGSLIKIAASSEVALDRIGYNPEKNIVQSRLKIDGLGKIYSLIRKVLKTANEFEIVTPMATVGVRGTSLLVDVPDRDTAVFAVLEGKVVVRDFAVEQGLSTDDTGLMMDFLHEVVLSTGKADTYKKGKGFSKSAETEMAWDREKLEFSGMETASSRVLAAAGNRTPEIRQAEADRIREEALKQ